MKTIKIESEKELIEQIRKDPYSANCEYFIKSNQIFFNGKANAVEKSRNFFLIKTNNKKCKECKMNIICLNTKAMESKSKETTLIWYNIKCDFILANGFE